MALSLAKFSHARPGTNVKFFYIKICSQMIVLSVGIDTLKALGKCKAVDYTWAHGRSCIVLSFFFAINTVIGKQYCFSKSLLKCSILQNNRRENGLGN